MIENCILDYLYNELFNESNEEKCTVFQNIVGLLLFVKVLLKTAQLLSKLFPSSLFLCILYFIFHKGKDTSGIPQRSASRMCFPHVLLFL